MTKYFYKKTPAIQYLDTIQKPNYRLWQLDVQANRGTKQFFVGTAMDAFKVMHSRPYIYETIRGRSRLVIDLDIKDKENARTIVDHILKTVIQAWNQCFSNNQITMRNVISLRTKLQPSKHSSHHIINGYCFESHHHTKQFAQWILRQHPELKAMGFDVSIYSRDRAFRTIGSTKMGRDFPLRLWKLKDGWKNVTSNDFELFCETLACGHDEPALELPSEIFKNEKSITTPRERKTSNQNPQSTIRNNDVPNLHTIKHWLRGLPSCYYEDYAEWIKVSLAIKSWCVEANVADEVGAMMFDEFSKRSSKYDGGAYDHQMNVQLPDTITWRSISYWLRDHYLGIDTAIESIPRTVLTDRRFEVSAVSKYYTENQIICMVGKPGSGKSYVVSRLFKSSPYISIVYRRTLSKQQVEYLPNAVCYMECRTEKGKQRFNLSQGKTVCFDSLFRIDLDKVSPSTVLWLDESSALIEYILTSPTFDRRRMKLYSIFTQLVRRVGKIVISDADLSSESLRLIEQLRNSPSDSRVLLELSPSKITLKPATIYYDDRSAVVRKLLKLVSNGEQVVVGSDSAKLIRWIASLLPSDSKLLYTAQEGDVEPLGDVGADKLWKNIKAVLYSPTITTGVSYTNVESAPHVFMFFMGTVRYQTAVQMVERSRSKRSITYSVEARHHDPEHWDNQMSKDWLLERVDSVNHFHKRYETLFHLDHAGDMVLSDSPFTQSTIQHMTKDSLERGWVRERLERLLQSRGYDLKIIRGNEFSTPIMIVKPDETMLRRVREVMRCNESADDLSLEELAILNRLKQRMEVLGRINGAWNVETEVGWRYVRDPNGISALIRFRMSLMKKEALNRKVANCIVDRGVLSTVRSDLLKYQMLQTLERVLGIEDRMAIDVNMVMRRLDHKVVLPEGLWSQFKTLFSVRTTSDHFKSSRWYDVYSKGLLKAYRHQFSGLIETTRHHFRVEGKKGSVVVVRFLKDQFPELIQLSDAMDDEHVERLTECDDENDFDIIVERPPIVQYYNILCAVERRFEIIETVYGWYSEHFTIPRWMLEYEVWKYRKKKCRILNLQRVKMFSTFETVLRI